MNNTKKEPIYIACSTDNNYALHLLIMLQSLAKSHPADVHFYCYVLNTGLDEATKKKLIAHLNEIKSITYELIDISKEKLSGLMTDPFLTHLSVAALLRLFLPKLLPPLLSRVFYIDSDILIQGDIRPMYEMDFANKHLIAVHDMCEPSLQYLHETDSNVPASAPAFNTGVIVLNLNRFRESDAMAKVMEKMRDQPKWSDQEGLNAVLYNEWTPATFHYNLQSTWHYPERVAPSVALSAAVARGDSLLQEVAIVHFTGAGKPWNSGWAHPHRVIYEEAMQKSGWFTPIEWLQWKASRLGERVFNRLSRKQ